MKKVIPFIKQEKSPVALDSKGPKPSLDGKIVDHGCLGDLNYEVFARGVIHIFDDSNLKFKKDIYIFEEEIKNIDFEKCTDGDSHLINGSGDNDHLLFTKENGDLKISLKRREYEALGLLKSILAKSQSILKRGN